MPKHLLLPVAVIGLALFSATTAPPTTITCTDDPTAQFRLDVNGVSALITNGGDLWFDGSEPAYNVTEPGQASPATANAVFAGALWFAGSDPGGNIKLAAQQYGRSLGNFDYGPGPLDENGNAADNCTDWDRVWPITRTEVNIFRQNFDPQNPNPSVIPVAVLGWPGLGNPRFEEANGFDLPTSPQGMAPFFDVDLDGIYDPYSGDYPLFCGDQAVWTVFNDARIHEDSGSPDVTLFEVQLLAYAFNAADDDPLHRTTFYDYKLINRGQEDILNFHAGHWIDFDLGCYTDDYIGSSAENNLVYAYNRNEQDQQNCDAGVPSFSTPGVAQIAQVLRASSPDPEAPLLYSATAAYNAAVNTNPTGTLDPITVIEYYRLMRGQWRDGSPMTRSGQGYGSTGDTTRYVFDGDQTLTGAPWVACTEFTAPNDPRVIMSSGPYTVQPGAVINYTMAMTTVFNVPYADGCPDTAPIFTAAQAIKAVYDDNCVGEGLVGTDDRPLPASAVGLEAFPNPTSGELTFRLPAGRTITRLDIFDATGRQVLSAQPAAGQLTVDLAAEGIAPGVYSYRLRTGGGSVVSGKVILRQ